MSKPPFPPSHSRNSCKNTLDKSVIPVRKRSLRLSIQTDIVSSKVISVFIGPSRERFGVESVEFVTSKGHENESVRMKVFVSILKPRIQTSYHPDKLLSTLLLPPNQNTQASKLVENQIRCSGSHLCLPSVLG